MTFHRKRSTFQNNWRQSSGTKCTWTLKSIVFEKYSFSYGTSQILFSQNPVSIRRQSNVNPTSDRSRVLIGNEPFSNESMWRSIGKGVLFKTLDVSVQVHSVPELWRQMFRKAFLSRSFKTLDYFLSQLLNTYEQNISGHFTISFF